MGTCSWVSISIWHLAARLPKCGLWLRGKTCRWRSSCRQIGWYERRSTESWQNAWQQIRGPQLIGYLFTLPARVMFTRDCEVFADGSVLITRIGNSRASYAFRIVTISIRACDCRCFRLLLLPAKYDGRRRCAATPTSACLRTNMPLGGILPYGRREMGGRIGQHLKVPSKHWQVSRFSSFYDIAEPSPRSQLNGGGISSGRLSNSGYSTMLRQHARWRVRKANEGAHLPGALSMDDTPTARLVDHFQVLTDSSDLSRVT